MVGESLHPLDSPPRPGWRQCEFSSRERNVTESAAGDKNFPRRRFFERNPAFFSLPVWRFLLTIAP